MPGALKAAVIAVLAVVLGWSPASPAQTIPQPPCAGSPLPIYAPGGEPPLLQVWSKTSLASWLPPACTGWNGPVGNLLVALAGTFNFAGSTDQLLSRFGAVSTLSGIRYWSVSDKDWRPLIISAAALGDPASQGRRADFAAPEMKAGSNLFFAQRDRRSTGDVVYRMRVLEAGADLLVLDLENVSPVRAFILTIFEPGDMKLLYFLKRAAGGNWNLYALLSANSSYAEGNEASFINRAVAFYRHFSGAQTDGAPPLAR